MVLHHTGIVVLDKGITHLFDVLNDRNTEDGSSSSKVSHMEGEIRNHQLRRFDRTSVKKKKSKEEKVSNPQSEVKRSEVK